MKYILTAKMKNNKYNKVRTVVKFNLKNPRYRGKIDATNTYK